MNLLFKLIKFSKKIELQKINNHLLNCIQLQKIIA